MTPTIPVDYGVGKASWFALLLLLACQQQPPVETAAAPRAITCFAAGGRAYYFGANRRPLDSTATLVLLDYSAGSTRPSGAAALLVAPYSAAPETAGWRRLGDSLIVNVSALPRQWEFRLRHDHANGLLTGMAVLTTGEMAPGPDNQPAPVRFGWRVSAGEISCDSTTEGRSHLPATG